MAKSKYTYDIECYPNLLSFKFKNFETGQWHTFVHYSWPDDPTLNRNDYSKMITFLNTQVSFLIGYNSIDYDDLLTKCCMLNKDRFIKADVRMICQHVYEVNCNIFDTQNKKKDIPQLPELYLLKKKTLPFHSIDLIQQFNRIDRVGLKRLAIAIKWPRVQDLPIKPGSIITPDQLDLLLNYEENDVNITEKVLKDHLSQGINDRIKIGEKLGMNVINKCDTDIGKVVIAKYYEEVTGIPYAKFSKLRTYRHQVPIRDCISPKIRFLTPSYQRLLANMSERIVNPQLKESKTKKKKQFEFIFPSKYLNHTIALGGIHSNNPPEILAEDDDHWYIDIDATSFYPYIMCNEGFYPAHLGPIFLKVFKQYILDNRVEAKRLLDKVLALMLKFSANAAYGQTKSEYSWMYDPKVTLSVCINGQLFLLMLMEALELYSGCTVVYSNTDGLTVKVPKTDYGKFVKICRNWETSTGFELEQSIYSKMIIQDVNNFLIFTKKSGEDRIKAKGSYVWKRPINKGYEFPVIAWAVKQWFDEGIPVEKTITECTDIYDFMKAQKAGDDFQIHFKRQADPIGSPPYIMQKSNRWAITKDNPEQGKLMKYDTRDGSEQEMEKGYKCVVFNDVDETIDFKNYNIDYDFYIHEATAMISLKPAAKESHAEAVMEQGLLFT